MSKVHQGRSMDLERVRVGFGKEGAKGVGVEDMVSVGLLGPMLELVVRFGIVMYIAGGLSHSEEDCSSMGYILQILHVTLV